MIRATHKGTLWDRVDVYVLEDGRRVLSQRGAVRALSGTEHGQFSRYIAMLPAEYPGILAGSEIEFETGFPSAQGFVAHGIESGDFLETCKSFAKAAIDGHLTQRQRHLAQGALAIVSACAGVGIAALIDEATGYIHEKPPAEYQRIFSWLFSKELKDWQLTFFPDLVKEMCRLDGHPWRGGVHPSYLKSTNRALYRVILGKEIADELKRRNPNPRLRSNHHQLLEEDPAAYFRQELHGAVYVIARQSSSKHEFWDKLRTHYRVEDRASGQLGLELIW